METLNEQITRFTQNWGVDPVEFQDDNIIIIKLYIIQRSGSIFQNGTRNTQDQIVQRNDYFTHAFLNKNQLDEIGKYISFDSFTITKELREFSKLQDIQKSYLSFIPNIPNGYNTDDVLLISTQKFDNYLTHLNFVKQIKVKTSKIVRDKFNVNDNSDIDTSAIFANVGYIVKGFEGKYIALSRNDKSFIKNFMDEQIKDGAYRLTIKETLPLYKESIKEIIKIGKGLLQLTTNKTQLKSFSKKILGEERKSLESCWQLYFDKYLRMLL